MVRRRPFRLPMRGWFEDIDVFDEMDRVMEDVMETARTWTAGMAGESGEPVVCGFSMEMGPDRVPKIQHFGNVRPTRMGVVEKGVREPFTSTIVDEDTGSLKVTVEMPGVSKENISLSATENALTIDAKAEDGKRKYYKELLELPAIDPNSADAVYNNGILEITLKLKEEEGEKGKSIHIK